MWFCLKHTKIQNKPVYNEISQHNVCYLDKRFLLFMIFHWHWNALRLVTNGLLFERSPIPWFQPFCDGVAVPLQEYSKHDEKFFTSSEFWSIWWIGTFYNSKTKRNLFPRAHSVHDLFWSLMNPLEEVEEIILVFTIWVTF